MCVKIKVIEAQFMLMWSIRLRMLIEYGEPGMQELCRNVVNE
jgi:hypothetical protein